MKNYYLLIIIFSVTVAKAQLSAVTSKTDYPFWIHLPEAEVLDNNPPILVFLHGKSLSGTDLNKVKRYGVLKAIQKGRKIPAIVIAPQVVNTAWDADKVLEVIQYVQANYKTDTNRVYVCGMSLGGYGTFEIAGKHPDKITAGVAICGGGNSKDACNLAKVPLWVLHGDKDTAVPLSESQKIVSAIKKCENQAELIFTIKPGASHSSVEQLFHEDEMYDWLFAHTR
jgi:predicted peptidase